jgi:aldose 1-epimerase
MSVLPTPAYSACLAQVDGVDIVRLSGPSGVSVSIAPQIGNNAFEFLVNGKNAFWFPYHSVGEFATNPDLCGNPFLAPWANRLDEHAFYANGVRYELNRDLGNYLLDATGQPIHGLLLHAAQWDVIALRAGPDSARVDSRLEFGRYPALMAQFPFDHSIEMTYILKGETLETRTTVSNESAETMPLSVGFHPYFQLHESPRDSWRVRLAADSVWSLNDRFTPTGANLPIGQSFPQADDLPLRGELLDHVFDGLQRDGDGWARFHVRGTGERITVDFGPRFPVAVVYAPTGDGQSFVCFEPMSGITNAFSLAHRGLYSELPQVPAGGAWTASFRICVEGF